MKRYSALDMVAEAMKHEDYWKTTPKPMTATHILASELLNKDDYAKFLARFDERQCSREGK